MTVNSSEPVFSHDIANEKSCSESRDRPRYKINGGDFVGAQIVVVSNGYRSLTEFLSVEFGREANNCGLRSIQ